MSCVKAIGGRRCNADFEVDKRQVLQLLRNPTDREPGKAQYLRIRRRPKQAIFCKYMLYLPSDTNMRKGINVKARDLAVWHIPKQVVLGARACL